MSLILDWTDKTGQHLETASIKLLTQPVFLHFCPDCMAHLTSTGRATWVAMKKYNLKTGQVGFERR